MSSLPNDVSDTILNNAASYGGSIEIVDFCPYVQVLAMCVYVYIYSRIMAFHSVLPG